MKIKNFPKELVINDFVWEIKFKRCIAGDANLLGLCDSGDKTIYIKLGQSSQERLSTLIHESIHALEFEYEIKIPHRLIYKLEGPLARLLSENLIQPLSL